MTPFSQNLNVQVIEASDSAKEARSRDELQKRPDTALSHPLWVLRQARSLSLRTGQLWWQVTWQTRGMKYYFFRASSFISGFFSSLAHCMRRFQLAGAARYQKGISLYRLPPSCAFNSQTRCFRLLCFCHCILRFGGLPADSGRAFGCEVF
jgi:hypothetical protein